MKNSIFRRAILLMSVCISLLTGAVAQPGKLIVNVKRVDARKGGALFTALFNREGYLTVGKEILSSIDPVTSDRMKIVFDEVPPGTYGVVTFHDIDQDKKLTTNVFGVPVEPVGFSRDALILFGPPVFSDISITIKPDQVQEITFRLR